MELINKARNAISDDTKHEKPTRTIDNWCRLRTAICKIDNKLCGYADYMHTTLLPFRYSIGFDDVCNSLLNLHDRNDQQQDPIA